VNIPNYLSLARILAIPAMVAVMLTNFHGRDLVAFAIFAFASLTDWVDGWLARRKGMVTALICLVELHRIPAWAAIVIIGREIAVSGFRAMASSKGVHIPASIFGKAKMSSESWIIGTLVLGPIYLGKFYVVAKVGLWLVLALAIFSALEYFVRFGPRIISQQAE
jgi:CDP-diacylglycerol--glycerol-3-phosphate 3-phosphatidyltransferase